MHLPRDASLSGEYDARPALHFAGGDPPDEARDRDPSHVSEGGVKTSDIPEWAAAANFRDPLGASGRDRSNRTRASAGPAGRRDRVARSPLLT